ncbi:MAG TPA: YicC/YloC family endoribonuclease [Nitrospirota bacterium]|nr:YicC/YloC family endoribonuclease [Nitrospirota bacterium]
MIRSMTGYGRKESGNGSVQVTVEVRSLNNRFLDIQIKSPRVLAAMESRIRKAVQDRFARGRFDIFISRNGDQERSGVLAVNDALAAQYIQTLRDMKIRYNLAGDIEIASVAAFPDILSLKEEKEDPEELWSVLAQCLGQALDDLGAMRTSEGAALATDIRERLETIERSMADIRQKAPATVEQARKRMNDALARLLNEQPDPGRIAQEIAVLAERTDVTEELTRLGSHVTQFRAMLGDASPEGVGRKLDFLIQEMGREINTISSKAMDASISLDVVSVKSELEKIREQVQNIE